MGFGVISEGVLGLEIIYAVECIGYCFTGDRTRACSPHADVDIKVLLNPCLHLFSVTVDELAKTTNASTVPIQKSW